MRMAISPSQCQNDDDAGRQFLPTNVRAVSYDLHLEPDLQKGNFNGLVSIELYVLRTTDSITLHAGLGIEILSTVLLQDENTEEVSSLSHNRTLERVTVNLNTPLHARTKVILKFTFTGSLKSPGRGFYTSPTGEVNEKGEPKYVASVILEPIDARRVLPCFDEPGLKARFSVTLVVEKNLTCLGNMPVRSTHISHGNRKTVVFETTPPMAIYLLSLVVGDLKYVETNSFRVPVRIYAASNRDIKKAGLAVEYAATALSFYETAFDLAYPLPKMDFIAVPGMVAGAVENWGLIIFGENELLFDSEDECAEVGFTGINTIFHELAHQWFGNIVTMDHWDALWLSESFASWATVYALSKVKPELYPVADFLTGHSLRVAFDIDSTQSSHPIEIPVNSDADITKAFDSITYGKGAAVLRMLSSYLGEEIFLAGLRRYLKAHLYGSASSNDLWDALSYASGEGVVEIMRVWTKEANFPVVVLVENEEEGTVTATQHRYIRNTKSASTVCTVHDRENDIPYPLPLHPKNKHGKIKQMTLFGRSTTFTISEDFYKINANQLGFYRVSYCPRRLEILSRNVKEGLLSIEDRIGLVSDTLEMTSSGFNSTKTSALLNLLQSFSSETNYFVWKQVTIAVSTVTRTWAFEKEAVVNGLKRFQQVLIKDCLKRIGWSFNNTDEMLEQMLKALIFEYAADDNEVHEKAASMFAEYIKGDMTAINANILETVLKIVLSGEDAETYYNSVLDLLQNKSTTHTRPIYLGALGYVQTEELMNRALEFAMRPETIDSRGTSNIIATLTHHKAGAQKVWSWFKENVTEIMKVFSKGRDQGGRMIQTCTSSLGTREQLEDVKTWFANYEMKADGYYLAQALEAIEGRVKWVERDRNDVERWLQQNL